MMIKCFLTLQQVRDYIRLIFQITKIPLGIQTVYPSLKKRHQIISFPDIPEVNILKLPQNIEEKIYTLFDNPTTDSFMPEAPQIYTEQNIYTFFCIPFILIRQVGQTSSRLVLTIGPCFQKQMNEEFSAQESCWKNKKNGCFRDCTDEEIQRVSQHIPYWNLPHLCAVIQLLYIILFKTQIRISDLLSPSFIQNPDVDVLTTEELYQRRETYTFHTSFSQELKIWNIITKGETDKISEALIIQTFINTGKVAKTRIRQEKNIAICTTAIATRSAIMGGVPDDIAYTMSDSFIQKIEELQTPEEAILFNKTIISDFTKKVAEYKHKNRKKYSLAVNECIQYIEQHLHERITLEDLSDQLNLSISQISRKFKKEVGESIVDFYQRQKVSAACDMLQYSERTLLEISNILAFSSQSYFSFIFKKHTGQSPAEYKMNYHPQQKQTRA